MFVKCKHVLYIYLLGLQPDVRIIGKVLRGFVYSWFIDGQDTERMLANRVREGEEEPSRKVL